MRCEIKLGKVFINNCYVCEIMDLIIEISIKIRWNFRYCFRL